MEGNAKVGTGRVIAERTELEIQRARRRAGPGRMSWLPSWVRWLPPGLVLLALLLELTTPTRYSFASFLTAAVVLAALLSRPLVTFIIGGMSIGLLIGMHFALTDVYPDNVTGPVITLVLVTGFSTLLALILEHTTNQLVQVQAVAEATQLALLRPLPDRGWAPYASRASTGPPTRPPSSAATSTASGRPRTECGWSSETYEARASVRRRRSPRSPPRSARPP